MWKLRTKTQEVNHHNVLVSSVLSRRSIPAKEIEQLNSKPAQILQDMHMNLWQIPNMYEGAKQIIHAIEHNYEIWTFNDYDADGMTSGYVMTDGLRTICDNTIYSYYPDRKEGYGLSMNFCEKIAARQKEINQPILIITNDNGISKVREVDYLNEHGVEIVVTDHHEPQSVLPNCLVINPHVNHNENAYGHHLCGAGVSWKVLKAIEALADMQSFTDKYIYAVAIGTVADMMPPHIENQAIVRMGTMMMNSKYCPEQMKVFKDYIGVKHVTADSIAWEFGPRLNATGRLGKVNIGASFFYQTDKTAARQFVEAIEKINNERKEMTKKAKKDVQSHSFKKESAIALFDASQYTGGLTGIVAGKVLEETNKVACAYSENQDGILVGSARSNESIPMYEAFQEANKQGLLKGFGGHEGAAGFQLEKDKVEQFESFMTEYLAPYLVEDDEETYATEVDGTIKIKDLTQENYNALNDYYYDRESFVKPSFVLESVKVLSTRTSSNNPSNIEFEVDDGERTLKIWAWGMAEEYEAMGKPLFIDMIGSIQPNFMNKRYCTLNVQEIHISRTPIEKAMEVGAIEAN